MQTIGNGTGSLFGGGGGEQRLRPHHNQGFVDGRGGYHQTSFKCPRCDSLNTKFCYYNNYNLSQPRFFCKDCRRYWTKGGVLRNVPVGGGCRKTKRSKQKPGTRNHSSVAVAIASELKPANSQNSSTNSSPATMKTPFTLTEAVPTPFNFQESCFNPPVVDQCCIDGHSMLSETGTFKSLLTSSTDLEFSVASEITSFMQQQDEDQIVERQDSGRRHCGEINGGVAMEDWGLFDLSYWWNNNQDDQLNYYPI